MADRGEGTSGQSSDSQPKIAEKGLLFEWVVKKNKIIDHLLPKLEHIINISQVENWRDNLRELRNMNDIEEVSFALIGDAGTGKSSLINALLNIDFLPTGDAGNAVTRTPIEISGHLGIQYEAEIQFYSEIEWTKLNDLRHLTKKEREAMDKEKTEKSGEMKDETDYVGSTLEVELQSNMEVEQSNTNYIENLTKLVGQELKQSEANAFQPKLYNNISSLSAAEFRGKLRRFVTAEKKKVSPTVCEFVKCVKVRIPNPLYCSSRVTIIDLPGRGDVEQPVSQEVDEYIKNCNAVWIVTGISRCIDDNAKNIISEEFCAELIRQGRYGMISYICTAADKIDVKEEMETLDYIVAEEALKNEFEDNEVNLENALKQHKKQLKEKCSLERSQTVKLELQSILSAKISKIKPTHIESSDPPATRDEEIVFCVSSKEYLLFTNNPKKTKVFSVIENTEIPQLHSRMMKIPDTRIRQLKQIVVTKMELITDNIVTALQGTNDREEHAKRKCSWNEQNKSISKKFLEAQEKFVQEVKNKFKVLNNTIDLGALEGINKAEAISKRWAEYPYQTYTATVSMNGYFVSPKIGIVDFNKQLCDSFVDHINLAWLQYFDFFPEAINNFKVKVVAACTICHKSMSYVLSSQNEKSGMPTFINPQIESIGDKMKGMYSFANKSIFQMITTTVKSEMQPAYEQAKSLKKGGKGVVKQKIQVIETHIRENKEDLFTKLSSCIKNALVTEINRLEEECRKFCDNLLVELTGMYEANFNKASVSAGVDHAEFLKEIFDLKTQLSSLKKDIDNEEYKQSAQVPDVRSGNPSTSVDKPPPSKRSKTNI